MNSHKSKKKIEKVKNAQPLRLHTYTPVQGIKINPVYPKVTHTRLFPLIFKNGFPSLLLPMLVFCKEMNC